MLIEELLFEMPKSIEPTEFNLNDELINRRIALELLKNKRKRELEKVGPNTLYEIGRKIALLDAENKRVLYYVQWNEVFHKLIGKTGAAQIAVWRNRTKAVVPATLATRVFFDYLLPKYGVMITDALQTPDGKEFWVRRVTDAFARGLHVYYINLMGAKGGTSPELIEIHNGEEFDELERDRKFWGSTELFRARKILITQDKLNHAT